MSDLIAGKQADVERRDGLPVPEPPSYMSMKDRCSPSELTSSALSFMEVGACNCARGSGERCLADVAVTAQPGISSCGSHGFFL